MRLRLPSPCWLLALFAPGCFAPPVTPFDTESGTAGSDGASSSGLPPADDTSTAGTVDDTAEPPVCEGAQLLCGEACIDPDTDLDHCGGCDSPCATGEVCSGGQCTIACGEGLTLCDGACVDLSNDDEHCGDCENPCGFEDECDGGSCVELCQPNQLMCDGRCIDVTFDDANCGACDFPCSPGEHCADSRCLPACSPGLVECDEACIDPTSDSAHCGAGVDCIAEPGEACTGSDVCLGGACVPLDCPGFAAAAFDPAVTFADITENSIVGIAWDGMSYWSVSGGTSSGVTEGQQDGAGASVGTYMAGFDFRSVFTEGDGAAEVYARAYASPTILLQGAPGMWSASLDLVGGTLDAQAMVAWNALTSEFIAFNDGTLSRWDATGAFVGTVAFPDYGTLVGEHDFPQNRSIAWAGGCYLTIDNDTLSAWDPMGTRVDTATLNGSGAGFATNLSLSHANGHVFVSDDAQWRGYAVF